jgi:hypothetical protein
MNEQSMQRASLIVLLIMLFHWTFAQPTKDSLTVKPTSFNSNGWNLKFGTYIPVQYCAQLNYRRNHWSYTVNVGLLTAPYSKAIVGILKLFGTDEATADLIYDSYKVGFLPQAGLNYHFRRSYIGLYGQGALLRGKNTPKGIVESYYNIDINDYIANSRKSNEMQIDLLTNLYNVGLVYGRQFRLNSKQTIDLEFSFAKTIASKSSIYLNSIYNTALSGITQTELNEIYLKYSYIPSINLFWTYCF